MDDQDATNATEESKKPRAPKKGSIPMEELVALEAGIPTWDRKSFHMVGPRDGVRLAVRKSAGISRAYFYAAGDYGLIPDHPAIRVYSPEERKEKKLGGVQAELSFEHGLDKAREALGLLVEAVRNAPAPSASTDVGSEPAEPDAEQEV